MHRRPVGFQLTGSTYNVGFRVEKLGFRARLTWDPGLRVEGVGFSVGQEVAIPKHQVHKPSFIGTLVASLGVCWLGVRAKQSLNGIRGLLFWGQG